MMKKDLKRCKWCEGNELYTLYHDQEWGIPLHDDRQLFEFLVLETFQSGLSWITILKKRENFREAFDFFDYKKIALYNEDKVNSLCNNSGIVRNRKKIEATVQNAKSYIKIQEEWTSFSQYIWSFVHHEPIQNNFKQSDEVPSKTELSDTISKDLKKRGFKFIGSTVIYAHMQATGMVNDHITDCFRHQEIKYN